MQYKALLLDVDGTLVPVGPNTRPSEAVAAAITKAQEHIPVCLVSGRSLEWLEELFATLNLAHPCIINGGSQIINPKTKGILWERPITPESMVAVFGIIRAGSIPHIVSDDGIEYVDPGHREFTKPLAVKLTYFTSKETSDECAIRLGRIPDISTHKVYSWDKGRTYKLELYLTHAEATKAHAARELARLLGVDPSAIIAVGDARNDVPLLDACGLRVAMGNADGKLKKVAHYIAPSVEDDGVAHVIEKFILA